MGISVRPTLRPLIPGLPSLIVWLWGTGHWSFIAMVLWPLEPLIGGQCSYVFTTDSLRPGPRRGSPRSSRGETHGVERARPIPLLPTLRLFPMAQLSPPAGQCLRGPYHLGKVILTPVPWVPQKHHPPLARVRPLPVPSPDLAHRD